MTANIKEQIKTFRQQVQELHEKFAPLQDAILGQIVTDDNMHIVTDKGKLQFYLVDEVSQGFFHAATGLHRLRETFPAEPDK